MWIGDKVLHRPSGKYGHIVIVYHNNGTYKYGVDLEMGMQEKYLLYPTTAEHLILQPT